MKLKISPTNQQVASWLQQFVPDKDFFFVDETTLKRLEVQLGNVLIIPIQEFLNHPSYNKIELKNSLVYWRRSKEVTHVLVAQSDWITTLHLSRRELLLQLQVSLGRGLTFPLAYFSSPQAIPKEYIVTLSGESYVVIQSNMWRDLPIHLKTHLVVTYAAYWDEGKACEIPIETPPHIKKYSNRFPVLQGVNCLSSTLYAITKQEWMLEEWVHPETFELTLQKLGYVHIAEQQELETGDVLVWRDSKNIAQHASFYIGSNVFFNKNGQTVFNPWKIVERSELSKEWEGYHVRIYRKSM